LNDLILTHCISDDQFKHYIETLQRLFIKIHVLGKLEENGRKKGRTRGGKRRLNSFVFLEYWLNHYSQNQQKAEQEQYNVMITKLEKVCDIINNVIGGFVVTDITILLSKWLKRGSSWVNE
jgi:hypothetical protein